MSKDCIGNKQSIFTCLGAKNYSQHEREANDYYATEPKAVELLLEQETFSKNILEPALKSVTLLPLNVMLGLCGRMGIMAILL